MKFSTFFVYAVAVVPALADAALRGEQRELNSHCKDCDKELVAKIVCFKECSEEKDSDKCKDTKCSDEVEEYRTCKKSECGGGGGPGGADRKAPGGAAKEDKKAGGAGGGAVKEDKKADRTDRGGPGGAAPGGMGGMRRR